MADASRMRSVRVLLPAFCLGLLGAKGGCGSSPPDGEQRSCPNWDLVVMDCGTAVTYDARKVDADVEVANWAKANLSTSKEVLREVSEGFSSLDQEFQQACQAYNACAIPPEDFQKRLSASQDRERQVRACLAIAQTAEGPQASRDALTCLHQAAVPPEKNDDLALTFAVQAMRAGAGAPETLRGGETLREGDKMVFGVNVSKPAHLYLMQRTGPERRLEVLFPNPDIATVTNPIPANQMVRLPPKGQSFKVNGEDIGHEEVFVVASEQPLGDLGAALDNLRAGADPNAGKAAETQMADLFGDGDKCSEDRTRGLDLASDCDVTRGIQLDDTAAASDPFFAGQESSVRVRADPWDDTILQVFSFEHAK
jgi:hypothetical protein